MSYVFPATRLVTTHVWLVLAAMLDPAVPPPPVPSLGDRALTSAGVGAGVVPANLATHQPFPAALLVNVRVQLVPEHAAEILEAMTAAGTTPSVLVAVTSDWPIKVPAASSVAK